MDHDENDFQSQNFQIVGDESKFPPSLRSFALPKFDLDEHLQHLRFDSLVDTDVLLGIQGQGNNWIEDFSSGTSAIEFSSSAADNCSISRHNNVWSEATSSESVEMLLKSVGEDEMNDKKAITMEADAQNLLIGMIQHMDPSSRQVGDDTPLMGDIIQDDPSRPPDKFQGNLLGQDKDGSGVQTQVQGMSQNFNDEISGAMLDTSSLRDKIQSDGEIGARQCTKDENVNIQLDDTNKKCSVTSETLCKMVNNDETLDMQFMKATDGRGWDSSEVARGSPDSITCRRTREQVVEEHSVLNMSERSDLMSDDAQKERSQMLQHAKGNEKFLDGHEVDTRLCSKESSSFLEPARDSLVLTSEGFNVTEFSGNPDGLLEAIAYQGNAFNNDNWVGDKSSRHANEMSTLESERERFVQTDYVDISKESTPNQMTDHNDTGIRSTSEMEVEANSSIHMNAVTQSEETKVEISSEINHSNLDAQTLESAFEEKNAEAEIVEDVEESGCKLIASEHVILGESSLPAALNNAEIKICSSIPGKLHKAAEPSDVHTPSLEVSVGDEDVGPSTCPGTNSNNDDNKIVIGKAEATRSGGQNSDNVGDNSVLPAKKLVHDGSGADLPSIGVGLPSLKKYSNNDESHPGGSLVGDVAREQKEVSSPKLLESDSIGSDVKEVKLTGISSVSVSKSNSVVPLPTETVIITDPAAADCSPSGGLIQDVPVNGKVAVLDETSKCHQPQHTFAAAVVPQQKEGATSSQFSSGCVEFDEKVAEVSDSSLMKSEGHVDDRPLVDIGESSPLSNTIRPRTVLVEQPSSFVENPVASRCELQSLADKSVIHDETIVVEGNLVIHASSVKGKVNPEASSHEDKETTFGVLADPLNSDTNTSTTLSSSKAEAHLLTVEAGKRSLPEASCGSPTIISCSGHSQDEPGGSRALSIQIDPFPSGLSLNSFETVGSSDKIKYTTLDSKESTASEDDRSFTFEVGRVEELSEKDAGNQWKPFPIVQSSEVPKILVENSRVCHLETEGKDHGVTTKTTSEDRSTRAARSSNEKVTTPKGKSAKGTSTRKKSTDCVGKSCTTSSAPVGTISSGMQLVEIKPYTYTESNLMKTSTSTIVQSSSLPDLNSSSATTLFHQPFTDLQQVQLRAQIFVYGSLIQSIPPDEACMQSAFGETDGGRISWETIWHKAVERYQNQKSPVNSETPLHSHSVVRVPEQLTKSSSLQSKAVSTCASRSVGKVIAPAILNSTPPLLSSLWSVSTHDGLNSNLPRGAQLDFNQALSPLHSHPSSQTRQFPSNSTSWLSQNPRPGPWAVSAQSPVLNAATHYSTVPVVETVQVTPVRDSSMPHPASLQLVSPSTLLPTPSTASVPAASVTHLETQRKTGSPGNKNAVSTQKSRKRKKAAATEDFAETIPVSQSPTEPAFATAFIKTPSASSGLLLSTNMPSKVASEPIVSATTHVPPPQYHIIGSGNTEQKVIFSEETGNKIKQAKQQAEDAAVVAASVVSHSQGIWNQLAAQRNSGLVTEVEEKLASAAVAAAAAASVARAAAAAAQVASEAALQAKMMADEALDSAKTGSLIQSSEADFDVGKNLASLTPGSILKGKDKIHGPSSIISVAREATRRRMEAASAATKRAENLDAIMRAAELAAEAVSQVGAIIAMGDPLPFKISDLVEAGPEGSWKAYHPTSEILNKAITLLGKEDKNLDNMVHHCDQTPSNNKEIHKTPTEGGTFQDEQSIKSRDNWGGGPGSVVGNPSTLPDDSHERDHQLRNLKANCIQKGSIVEVISDKDGLRGGWFSARVLDVKDNKAHVCYNNLLSEDGSGQLKEWVSLESESNGAPRIRIAHPMLGTKYDGTRKRRREAAVGSCVWEVGDRVDGWMRDGWWEGIITGKNQLDETKLTVNFPAGGDSSLVQAWDLRPSLTWKDGQWIEWSRARENTLIPYEGDTPQGKRQKLGRPEAKLDAEVDSTEIGKLSKKIPPEDSGKEELGQLNLSAKDKIFSVGKNASEANISDALKMKRTGLQKEGSRVVFGVPKPGKKRKFMEVSKHYVSDKTVTSQGNDSLKFAKYLMPQAPRPWRNTSKVDTRDTSRVDSKGKWVGNSKSLGVKPVKSQASKTRRTTEKDNLSVTTVSASNGEKNGHGSSSNMRAGFTNENKLEKNFVEVSFPSSLGTIESLVPVSSVQSLSAVHAAKKKSSSAIESELEVKGKLTPALDKSTRSEKKPSENSGKAIHDAIEPRRSNRRIQPTSRLLEGLQSSLIISKIPTFSINRGSKALHRSSSSRGNTRGS